MCEGTGLKGFAKEFPDRFHDVGIAEQHALTFAAGLATQGVRPVVTMYSTFLQRAYDQIVHDVATQNLPVTMLIDRGGLGRRGRHDASRGIRLRLLAPRPEHGRDGSQRRERTAAHGENLPEL